MLAGGKSELSPLPIQDNAIEVNAEMRRERRQGRMRKELDGLLEDNAGKTERDKNILWRKIQRILGKNDDIANEYGHLHFFYLY